MTELHPVLLIAFSDNTTKTYRGEPLTADQTIAMATCTQQQLEDGIALSLLDREMTRKVNR